MSLLAVLLLQGLSPVTDERPIRHLKGLRDDLGMIVSDAISQSGRQRMDPLMISSTCFTASGETPDGSVLRQLAQSVSQSVAEELKSTRDRLCYRDLSRPNTTMEQFVTVDVTPSRCAAPDDCVSLKHTSRDGGLIIGTHRLIGLCATRSLF